MCHFRRVTVYFLTFAAAACGGVGPDSSTENTTGNGGSSTVTQSSTGGSSSHGNSITNPRTSPTTGGVMAIGGTTGTAGTDSTYPKGGTSSGTGGGAGTSTVTSTTPLECRVAPPANVPVPQVIKFQITNQTSTTTFVAGGSTCSLIPKIESCADNYQKAIATTGGCTQSCSSTVLGCIVCGACLAQATEVLPNATIDVEWSGSVYAFSQFPNLACTCYNESVAPFGKYRATISVYPTKDIPFDGSGPTRTVSVDFNYPDNDGIVEFSL